MNNQAYGKADDYFQSSKSFFSKIRVLLVFQILEGAGHCRHLLASSEIQRGLLQVALLVIHIINLSVHLVVRLLTMRNKSETREPKFLLSRIRTDMRDLGLPVLQDPITSHLGIHSSNISSKVLDRYIDGEQHPEESRPRNNSQRNNSRHGSYGWLHTSQSLLQTIIRTYPQVGYTPHNLFHLQTIIRTYPQGAVNFALMMSQMEGGFPVDYNTITDSFLKKSDP